jgi:hypothetical protein
MKAKKLGLAGRVLIGLAMAGGFAHAGRVVADNKSNLLPGTNVSVSHLSINPPATEYWQTNADAVEQDFPSGAWLRTFSKIYAPATSGEILAAVDGRARESTSPVDVYLGVHGEISGTIDNRLEIRVASLIGYEHRTITARQIWPEVGSVYIIPKDTSVTTVINLPELDASKSNSVYAIWRIETRRTLPGDIYPALGDGKTDIYDLAKIGEEWLVSSQPSGIPADTGNYLDSYGFGLFLAHDPLGFTDGFDLLGRQQIPRLTCRVEQMQIIFIDSIAQVMTFQIGPHAFSRI